VWAQALWTIAPGRAEIRRERLSRLAPDHVRVKASVSLISRGTEALVLAGRVPQSEWQRMRAPFQGGDFPFPVKYGYASVGRVVAGADGWIGRRVFVLHPHQDLYDVPIAALTAIPEAVSDERAALAANLETALNAVWDAGALPGDRIAIVGAGVVGALIAALCGRLPGAAVTLIDIDPARAALASALHVGFALPEAALRVAGDCDCVFHASASASGLATALTLAGDEARVIEVSWYGDRLVPAPLGADFHARRLTLISSQVSRLPPARRMRWDFARRKATALSLLADPIFDTLLAPALAFAEMPGHMPAILAPDARVLAQPIRY
jgi:hypothetical protein